MSPSAFDKYKSYFSPVRKINLPISTKKSGSNEKIERERLAISYIYILRQKQKIVEKDFSLLHMYSVPPREKYSSLPLANV